MKYRPNLEVLENRDCPTAFTWDTNSIGNWSGSGNWSNGDGATRYPGQSGHSEDTVIFDGTGTGICIVDVSVAINQLTSTINMDGTGFSMGIPGTNLQIIGSGTSDISHLTVIKATAANATLTIANGVAVDYGTNFNSSLPVNRLNIVLISNGQLNIGEAGTMARSTIEGNNVKYWLGEDDTNTAGYLTVLAYWSLSDITNQSYLTAIEGSVVRLKSTTGDADSGAEVIGTSDAWFQTDSDLIMYDNTKWDNINTAEHQIEIWSTAEMQLFGTGTVNVTGTVNIHGGSLYLDNAVTNVLYVETFISDGGYLYFVVDGSTAGDCSCIGCLGGGTATIGDTNTDVYNTNGGANATGNWNLIATLAANSVTDNGGNTTSWSAGTSMVDAFVDANKQFWRVGN